MSLLLLQQQEKGKEKEPQSWQLIRGLSLVMMVDSNEVYVHRKDRDRCMQIGFLLCRGLKK